MLPPRRGIIRAPQRSRTALRSFSVPLEPLLGEIGIDRWPIRVSGRWRRVPPAQTSSEYREDVATTDPELSWFGPPRGHPGWMRIELRDDAPSTLGRLRVSLSNGEGAEGQILVSATCNPTRTLAHLIERFATHDFDVTVAGLTPQQFFAAASDGVLTSLSGNDNWLPDADAVREALGPDPFGSFLPIFVQQFQSFVMGVVAPSAEDAPVADVGGALTATNHGVLVRVEWGRATSPQIETYFERFHGQARGLVRSAAQSFLTALDKVEVAQHSSGVGVERSQSSVGVAVREPSAVGAADAFSIRTELAQGRRLRVYAKWHDRIRFEIERHGRADYGAADTQRPPDRLMHIAASERRHTITGCRWSVVGDLVNECPAPLIGDLVRLISLVSQCCAHEGVDAEPIVSALLLDGGLVPGPSIGASSSLVDRLRRCGVIARVSIRGRDVRASPGRFALTGDYRAVQRAVLSTLLASEAGLTFDGDLSLF